MTLKYAGAVVTYRGEAITRHDGVNPAKLGRYTWQGRPFAQLAHAKAAINEFLQDTAQ